MASIKKSTSEISFSNHEIQNMTDASIASELLKIGSRQLNKDINIDKLAVEMHIQNIRAKLSKMLYVQLPKGSLIVSSLTDQHFDPIYSSVVKGISNEDREIQWKDIVSSGANQRFCNIYILRTLTLRG